MNNGLNNDAFQAGEGDNADNDSSKSETLSADL